MGEGGYWNKKKHIFAYISINIDTENLNIDPIYNILLKNDPVANFTKPPGDKLTYKTKENCVKGSKQKDYFEIEKLTSFPFYIIFYIWCSFDVLIELILLVTATYVHLSQQL